MSDYAAPGPADPAQSVAQGRQGSAQGLPLPGGDRGSGAPHRHVLPHRCPGAAVTIQTGQWCQHCCWLVGVIYCWQLISRLSCATQPQLPFPGERPTFQGNNTSRNKRKQYAKQNIMQKMGWGGVMHMNCIFE